MVDYLIVSGMDLPGSLIIDGLKLTYETIDLQYEWRPRRCTGVRGHCEQASLVKIFEIVTSNIKKLGQVFKSFGPWERCLWGLLLRDHLAGCCGGLCLCCITWKYIIFESQREVCFLSTWSIFTAVRKAPCYGPTYFTLTIPLLLMTWWGKEPGHQQSWYWPS